MPEWLHFVNEYSSGVGVILSALNLIILYFTLRAVIHYTRATTDMKDEIVRQNELTLRPLIVLSHQGVGERAAKLSIENIGNGPALNISLEIEEVLDASGEKLDVSFRPVDLIRGGQTIDAPYCDPLDLFAALTMKKDSEFKVWYSDLNDKIYYTSGILGYGKIRFINTKGA